MSLPCMILAAGFGTRMRPLTDEMPKPLIEVAGRALIDHALDMAEDAGAGPIAVNGHYRAEQMAAHLADGRATFLRESPEILGSGGGVRNALPVLGEGPLVTLNADAIFAGPNPIDTLMAAWDPVRMSGLLLLVPLERTVARQGGGDFRLDRDGRIAPDAEGAVYTGAQILGRGVVARWPEGPFEMREIWEALMAEGRLYGCLHPGYWADVGHPAGIAEAEAMLKAADV
ncbi:NTP transferase domain-containing protein [Rhodobacterales bacterium HKCCE3408]|nr:NTP transferase domain-containing protein [Rhodobacterales bacterium HKCCE3408]